jgi:hypothetical protein
VQELRVKVWPASEPPVEGILIDLDNLTETTFTGKTGTKATVRASEMLNDNGYAWVWPQGYQWKCVTVLNPKFGEFVTGYMNVLMVATSTTACEETVTIYRADWWEPKGEKVDITIKVEGTSAVGCDGGSIDANGKCVCPDGTNHHITKGKCVSSTATTVDINDTKLDYRITMQVGDKVTLKEVLPSGATAFKWKMPDLSAQTSGEQTHTSCITVANPSIQETFRELTLEAIAAECRFFLERHAEDSTNSDIQKFEFVVWPTRMPSQKGFLVDLDTTTDTYFEMPTNSEATVRLSEMKHDKGYACKHPEGQWKCLSVEANFGNFQTGFI